MSLLADNRSADVIPLISAKSGMTPVSTNDDLAASCSIKQYHEA